MSRAWVSSGSLGVDDEREVGRGTRGRSEGCGCGMAEVGVREMSVDCS
jgi:hypothetical protein